MTTRHPVDWNEIAELCHTLAKQLAGRPVDTILGVARGGLIPAALVAQELGVRHVLSAAVESYQGDQPDDALRFLAFPPDQAIVGRRILVVDDIWDSGRTAELLRRRIVDAGGEPTIAVLHYKPGRSAYPDRQPDVWLVETDDWIVYPWERDT